MNDEEQQIDWSKTTFEGVRKERLRQASKMTVRERLEVMDELNQLSRRLQAVPRRSGVDAVPEGRHMVDE
ncbi:hypothetical protein [Thauera propionica]|jgi:CRISPR-associated protein Csx17|uniref:hypothetical protein n=1 Tax=Thauera propionica TaxID=2019431 RepID=UPI0023EF8C3E|nr:hypothetical protein [Thauera propionica]MDD3677158.1 hypothetical protein [Thauera propionica]MDY0067517.1 hypothetical protein [Steroidobacteraceae bacterium]